MASLLSTMLERAIGKYMALDPEGLQAFSALQGKVIAVELRGINQTLFVFPAGDRIRVTDQYEGEPDTFLSGTPFALAKLGMSEGLGKDLFSGNVEIRGDIETGQQFRELLAEIDADWEEPLARIGGDIFAHQVGNFVRTTSRWATTGVNRLTDNLAEYVKEEARVLPTRIELENLFDGIDSLGMAADRLQARLQRLQTIKDRGGEDLS